MKTSVKILSLVLCLCLIITGLFGCSHKTDSTSVEPQNFRVTAYIVSDRLDETFDASNLDRVTDIILFGNATYDEQGKVNLSDSFESDVEFLRNLITNQRFYLNILGPSSQSQSDDWNEQMYDMADRNTAAFESGVLEAEIKNVLDKYDFDGIVFDYEFPLRKKDWKSFDKFIISLDSVLGDDYKIGMSMVGWNLKQSKEAMDATDFFEIMSYDLWDKEGNHATIDIAQDDIKQFEKKGYDKAKLDLGVPFYARPTTGDAYWYDYKSYCDDLDENGLYNDSATGLVFSFNTYDVIKEKTEMAIENGIGGMMVWHYSCDVPSDNEKSLFDAIDSVKQEAITNK
ncbi:MAG: glycoside hydrolase family 18 protein [Eubacterium sp.]|nr:glycoside hydrolase family 18 protein [Eubacterium sp.]